jgi:hypothetical protein
VCDNEFAALVLSNNLSKKRGFLPRPGKFLEARDISNFS